MCHNIGQKYPFERATLKLVSGGTWHPSGVRRASGASPGVSSQAPQPPANLYQPFGLNLPPLRGADEGRVLELGGKS